MMLNDVNPVWYESIWNWITTFLGSIGFNIDNFLKNFVDVDGKIDTFYDTVIRPMSEIVKIPLMIGLAILVVLGAIQVIKKSIKLILVILAVIAILFFVSGGMHF